MPWSISTTRTGYPDFSPPFALTADGGFSGFSTTVSATGDGPNPQKVDASGVSPV